MVKPWIVVVTQFHRAPIFGRIWLEVALYTLYAVAVSVLDRLALSDWINIHSSLHALLGLVLGMLLVFRTNTAYDRWWEGRKLWGQLVNESRNLAIKVQTCVQTDEADRQDVGQHLIAFAFALKEHLRRGVRLSDLDGFKGIHAEPKHVPAWIARSIYESIERWRQAEQVSGFELLMLDRHAAALMDVCGGCERIRRTPLAKSYRWFVRQLIWFYLITLPWGLAEDFGLWMVPTVAMIGYFMIGIETIAKDIEEPFGTDADDLRLDDVCHGIQSSVREILSSPRAVERSKV